MNLAGGGGNSITTYYYGMVTILTIQAVTVIRHNEAKLLLFSLESEHVGNCVSCVVSRKKTKESAYFSSRSSPSFIHG